MPIHGKLKGHMINRISHSWNYIRNDHSCKILYVHNFTGLCLVNQESSYRYNIVHTNSDGSTDYGLFQINSRYWCKGVNGYSGATCSQLNQHGCSDTCICM